MHRKNTTISILFLLMSMINVLYNVVIVNAVVINVEINNNKNV
jgi:hypothetical protein